MANKDRQKRSARKARAEERARVEAAQAASAPKTTPEDEKAKAKAEKKAAKAEAKKKEEKADPNKKPGLIQRAKNYLGDVRTEMRRVTWPSREELKSYSIAVLIMIVVAGVILWLVDTGVVALIAAFTGLRG